MVTVLKDNHPAMRRLILKLAVVVFVFASCKARNDSVYYHSIIQSLEAANQASIEYNRVLLNDLEHKLRDLQTSAKAAIWKPRADSVHSLSSKMLEKIGYLKSELLRQYSKNAGDKNTFEIAKAQNLFRQLVNYKQRILVTLNSDAFADYPNMREYLQKDSLMFLKTLPVLPNKYNLPINEKDWTDSTFDYTDVLSCITMLHVIENNVLVSENQLLHYFYMQAPVGHAIYERFSAIITLNSSYVKFGDSLEVFAGIGSFSDALQPTIIIDDKKIELNDEGLAVYSFRANKKPGKHFVPVRIIYTKPDGTTIPITKKCYYTVAH
jgi:hypothetical protein